MTQIEMTTEAETEDFAGDLSDEALDRGEGAYISITCQFYAAPPVGDR